MRSKLFVPGTRPDWFAKALAGAADAVSFDLEDSVPHERKGEARAAVARMLAGSDARDAKKVLLVRCNPVDSAEFEADVFATARPGLALLNLPKVESSDTVRQATAVLARAEQANGVATRIGLLVNIETAAGLARAAEIAAHPRVAGLQLGLGDLFEPLAIARRDPANVHAAMWALRLAAAQAGVFACDGAFADLADPDGFRAEAEMARRLGFVGKSCIHPAQVALANEAFAPDTAELAHARRIVAAAEAARARGAGAFVVDGRMVDLPFLKRAQALLASLGE